jgi:hypothetical protein
MGFSMQRATKPMNMGPEQQDQRSCSAESLMIDPATPLVPKHSA